MIFVLLRSHKRPHVFRSTTTRITKGITMKDQKNELATLSPQQSNPYTAMPEDFEVTRADEFADSYVPGHGQCGRDEKEYGELLKQANAPTVNKSPFGEKPSRATEVSDAEKPKTNGMGRD